VDSHAVVVGGVLPSLVVMGLAAVHLVTQALCPGRQRAHVERIHQLMDPVFGDRAQGVESHTSCHDSDEAAAVVTYTLPLTPRRTIHAMLLTAG
jgi:hypothetical protein